MSKKMRLWPQRARFQEDQIVCHSQLPRLLGRVLGVTTDRSEIYYRIEWVEQPEDHKMGLHIQQRYLRRIDPLTALASMA